MRVLFIVPYPTEGPSNRYRVEQYLPYLSESKIEYSLRPFYNSRSYGLLYKKGHYLRKVLWVVFFMLRRFRDILDSRNYDVVFIHREAYPFSGYIYEWLFRLFGKKLIYDFDDSIFLKKPSKIRKIVSISDYIIAGNDFLKGYASKHNRRVIVLPTCIDTDKYRPKAKLPNAKKIIIGWIGTSFTAIYLEILRGVYTILADKYANIEFRIVGGELKCSHLPLVHKRWSLESEPEELQEFDIGVMPLFNDDWARGKCAFKIIQYMSMGIPVVASRVGMNSEIIEDGREGFLVENSREWVERISMLIQDGNLRLEMGIVGRRKAEQFFSLKCNREKFISILREVDS